ncbi:chloride channel protein [Streptomyces virginiae]|uniref:chloride channel protein n=1 Tax=Streptomyces virginiae TaxID=1961 RepID=UPI0036AF47A9
MSAHAAPSPAPGPPPTDPVKVMASWAYLRVLLLCVVLGVPIALACFFFVALQQTLADAVWESLPRQLGYGRAPWWWPLPTLMLAGLILAPIVTRMPGRGGHLPVKGLGGPPIGPRELPGVALSAVATLPLGVVLGPEAPLMALGSGLALLAVHRLRMRADPLTGAILATAGSTAAISTIFGGPLVAAVLVLESAVIAGMPQIFLRLLPCLLASAAGALVFTGFGDWTGLRTGALGLPTVPPDVRPDAGDFLWGIPVAVVIAVLVVLARKVGSFTAAWTSRRTARRTVICAFAVGGCLTSYALLTGRSPMEAALSGQRALGLLAADPAQWPVDALVAMLLCKGLAWGLCLGAMRGGPIFPSIMLGATAALICNSLPGFGTTPALACGMAAAAGAVTGLPLSSSLLGALVLGGDSHRQTPLMVTAAVVAVVVARILQGRARRPAQEGGVR